MRTLHLFAGAGGGLLADLTLGHRPVCAVEIDPYCCRVLRERSADGWFPGLHVHEGDIRLFDPSDWKERVDSIHAGFPCQDISVAGSGAGIDGERSGLWREVVRVARAIRPRELFLENSPAITSRGLGTVLGDLADMGFDAEWCVLGASAIGAPHLRARWWCLARRYAADSDGDDGQAGRREHSRRIQRGEAAAASGGADLADAKGRCGRPGHGETEQVTDRDISGDSGQSVADAGHGLPSHGWPARPEATAAQRPGGWCRPAWLAAEPDVGRVAHGVAARVDRIRTLGNGQVPIQAAAAYLILDARCK